MIKPLCVYCNDEGVDRDDDGEIVGYCDCAIGEASRDIHEYVQETILVIAQRRN